ncbi:MAG: hypothetical protein QNI84_05500 [Henriciella sp.]|nr:hypothetical protein [Henriciella sp.]
MAQSIDPRTALKNILEQEELFPRVRPAEISQAAVKLASKQIIAAGQSIDDLKAINASIGDELFAKCLQGLTAHQIKLLARRLDPGAEDIQVNTGNSALRHTRALLSGADAQTRVLPDRQETDADSHPAPKKNKYLGRKSFRTGR